MHVQDFQVLDQAMVKAAPGLAHRTWPFCAPTRGEATRAGMPGKVEHWPSNAKPLHFIEIK